MNETSNRLLTINRFPAGQIFPPPSKSVGHRALICGALAGGGFIVRPGDNQDIQATVRCLSALGARLSARKGGNASHGGCEIARGLPDKIGAPLTLDCGESGSTLRFLIPLAALYDADISFTGGGRLMERPLTVYESCLGGQGVAMTRGENRFAVRGPLRPGVFHIPGDVSSQFITGLLFALPLLSGDSEIRLESPLQSASYVDLTLAVLRDYGIQIDAVDHRRYVIGGNQRYRIRDYTVEADFSGAAFFLAAAALGRPLEVMGLNLNSAQGDRAFLQLLSQAGYTLSRGAHGGIAVSSDHGFRPDALTVDVGDIPDLVPPLAALLAFCRGESRIVNAGRLRIKESDRLTTVARQLSRLGADITEGSDFLVIRGKPFLSGGSCQGENDHRIAMMCGVAAIGCKHPVTLSDYECVAKSYPDFWNDFMKEESP